MKFNLESLLIGVLVGGAIASIIWIISVTITGDRNKKSIKEKNSLINLIGELLVEIDNLITSYRSGIVSLDVFNRSLNDKINSVNKLFKPNLHLFDIYYVKFIEITLVNYCDTLKMGVAPLQYENKEEFEAAHNEVKPQSEQVVEQNASLSQNDIIAKESNEISGIENTSIISAGNTDITDTDMDIDSKRITQVTANVENEIEDIESKSEIEDFKNATIEDAISQKDFLDELPVEAGSDSDDSNLNTLNEKEELKSVVQQNESSTTIPEDQTGGISFEEMTLDVLADVDEETTGGFAQAHHKETKSDDVALQDSLDDAKNSIEDEFYKETCMELDMSKIPGFHEDTSKFTYRDSSVFPTSSAGSKAAQEKSEIAEPDKYQVNDEPVFEIADVSTNNFDNYVPQEDSNQEEEAVFEKKPDSNGGTNSEKGSDVITGDDIADKIDSFFGIGK